MTGAPRPRSRTAALRVHALGCAIAGLPARSSDESLARLFAGEATAVSEERAAERARAALFGSAVPERRLARYRLDGILGAGAMGEVWRAHDPELGRDVAIKLVKRASAARTERLTREARALARLSHPHVVQVFDVGRYPLEDGAPGVFVVMELVDGVDLASWLATSERPWRDVVAVFADAASGLHAAHAQGIVHRDFKPANVLIGRDGRVRVGDFGLARASGTAPSGPLPVDLLAAAPNETQGGGMTESGAVIGTPLYMAPEQHAGTGADARSDQYAFCVALYEALYRVRPFRGTIGAVVSAKLERDLAVPTEPVAIPEAIHAALLRGLSPDPEVRWPSMLPLRDALLGAQRRRPARWRRGAVAIAVGLAGAGVLAMSRPSPACTELVIPWDAEHRARVHAAIAEQASPAAVGTALETLDARARALDRDATCGVGSRNCLRVAATAFATTVEVFERGDPFATRSALSRLDDLPDAAACTDPTAVASTPGLERHRDALARAHALASAGLAAIEPLPPIDAAADDARGLAAELEYVAACAHDELGDPDAALPGLRRAYFAAIEADVPGVAIDAALRTAVSMVEAGDDAEVDTWIRHAEAVRGRATLDDTDAARAAVYLGIIAIHRAQADASIAHFERAIALCSAGTCPTTLITALTNLASLRTRAGRDDEAVELVRRALDVAERRGSEHDVASVRIDYSRVLLSLDPSEALAQAERASAVVEQLDGPRSLRSARALFAAAQALVRLERPAEAVVVAERAWSILRDRTSPGDPEREAYRALLASAQGDAGDLRGSLRGLDAILAEESGDLLNRISVMINRGVTRLALDDAPGAIEDARAAREHLLAWAPERTDLVVVTYVNESEALERRDGCAVARDLAEELREYAETRGNDADRAAAHAHDQGLRGRCGAP